MLYWPIQQLTVCLVAGGRTYLSIQWNPTTLALGLGRVVFPPCRCTHTLNTSTLCKRECLSLESRTRMEERIQNGLVRHHLQARGIALQGQPTLGLSPTLCTLCHLSSLLTSLLRMCYICRRLHSYVTHTHPNVGVDQLHMPWVTTLILCTEGSSSLHHDDMLAHCRGDVSPYQVLQYALR
jgi:hypothetical protein